MAREWFDYDPLTGCTEYYEEHDGKISIHTEQDVSPVLDWAARLRNEGLPDANWKKNGVSVYAVLPAIVLGQMAKKGIRFLDQNHVKAVVDEVNQNYPHLKTTNKRHALKR
jgi:hypothetical protein